MGGTGLTLRGAGGTCGPLGECQRAGHLFGPRQAPKGVQRRLGIKALLVPVNILTTLYKKLAGVTG